MPAVYLTEEERKLLLLILRKEIEDFKKEKSTIRNSAQFIAVETKYEEMLSHLEKKLKK